MQKDNESKHQKFNKKGLLSVNESEVIYYANDKCGMSETEIEEEMERIFGCDNLQKVIEEADRYIKRDDAKYLTHDEVFSNLWRNINDRK